MKSDHNTRLPVDADIAEFEAMRERCVSRMAIAEAEHQAFMRSARMRAATGRIDWVEFDRVHMHANSIPKSVEDRIDRSGSGEVLCLLLLLAAAWIVWAVVAALVVFA